MRQTITAYLCIALKTNSAGTQICVLFYVPKIEFSKREMAKLPWRASLAYPFSQNGGTKRERNTWFQSHKCVLHHGPYYRSRLGTTYENLPYHQASLIISKMASASKAIQVLRNFLMGVRNDSLHSLFVKKEKTKKIIIIFFIKFIGEKKK